MVTTNDRSFMVASISAVATICASAPSSTQGQNATGGVGSDNPVAATTTIKNTIANGNPYRKRTWVAPTVPSAAVSSRCMALRAVWPAAASSVKGIQRRPVSTEVVQSPRSGGFQHAGAGPTGGHLECRKFEGHAAHPSVIWQEFIDRA